jgi:hypothetical protein
MLDNLSPGIKGVLLIVSAYVVTLVATIIIIAVFITFLIDASNCYAMGPSLLALWGTTAVVFLASSIVVGVVAWKIIPSTAGRVVTVAVYGVSALVTYIVIAFVILVAFNC